MTVESWRRAPRRALGWLSLLAGAVGLLGCPGYFYTSRAYFANNTREPVKVRVQALLADVECAKMTGRSAELLTDRQLFGDAVTYEVAAGQALPLDLNDEELSGSQRETCAALVQVLGFPDQVVFWPPDAPSVRTETKLAEAEKPEFLAQSLTLEGHGEVKGLAAGDGLEVTPLPPLASGMTALVEPPASLGWSGTPRTDTDFLLLQRQMLPDGCSSLLLGKDLDGDGMAELPWPLFLCAPSWSFPFEVGDELAVVVEKLAPPSNGYGAGDEQPQTRHLALSGDGRRVDIWLNASKPQLMAVGPVVGQGAPGRHTTCGAYVEPASIELTSPRLVLLPGEDREGTAAGRRTRAFLGRADEVLVAPDDCEPEYSSLGTRFDLLILNLPAEESP